MLRQAAVPTSCIVGFLLAYAIFLPGLPAFPCVLLGTVVMACWLRGRALWGIAALIGASLLLNGQLADRYHAVDPAMEKRAPGDTVRMVGQVVGLPEQFSDYTRFRFKPLRNAEAGSPHLLLVYWYRNAPEILPGQQWRLELSIRPPAGLMNFQGSDRERWLFAEGIGGLATVRQGYLLRQSSNGWLDRLRLETSRQISSIKDIEPWSGIIRALAVADRSGIQPDQQHTLTATGTSHLLAISGLHIGLAFLFAFWAIRLLIFPANQLIRNATVFCSLGGWLAALAYAGMAGWSTSAIRSLTMLSVAILVNLLRHRTGIPHAWLLALAVVLLTNVMTPLQAGTWLSFGAVAALLGWFATRPRSSLNWPGQLLQAQLAVMIVTFPLSAWWFQLASPTGMIANLVAIPWVSFVVVPLVLVALIALPLAGEIARMLLILSGKALLGLFTILEPLAKLAAPLQQLALPTGYVLVPAMLAAGVLLLPRGLRLQGPALLLMLPILLPAAALDNEYLGLDILDVGQGTAVLMQKNSQLLLYDSGPGDGNGRDLVDSVIHPAISANGFSRPDLAVISHADLDHAGGLEGLRNRYPDLPIVASLPEPVPGVDPCDDRLNWQWPGMTFKVLHPSPYLPYLGNDSSCVLDVNAGEFRILHTGDISSAVESRLARPGAHIYRILMVPHHGSLSSSSQQLLHATVPELAIATAGLNNRFGFPRPEIQQRYRRSGIRMISTDQCGAIRLEFDPDGTMHARSARRERPAPWRWPAGAGCP